MNLANRNTLWAEVFVTELAKQGLRSVCVGAGSRSTPLTIAFAASNEIDLYSHIDERSAAYFALGIAKASGKPVALVCTSGTAAANLYPAIIEANYADVPLLILTADRPPELRDSGSNQTIDQVKMFGDHVRWFADLPLPEARPSPRLLAALKVFAARAWSASQAPLPGPVHLNFPFRKPLEPTPVPEDIPEWLTSDREDSHIPGAQISRGRLAPTEEQIEQLASALSQTERGWIVCGPRTGGAAMADWITQLAQGTGFPVLVDALSGLRFGEHINTAGVTFLAGYENYLGASHAFTHSLPQAILRFGDLSISNALAEFLDNLPAAIQIHITENGRWRDDRFHTNQVIWAQPEMVCRELIAALENKHHFPPAAEWVKPYQDAEALVWKIAPELINQDDFEGGILADVVASLPPHAALYVSNSLPVRHLDQYVPPASKPLAVFANRGASGIDGIISSALGAATVLERPTVLVTGDLSFYHDLTGLIALNRYSIKATIVIINNNGGGIFQRLPVSNFDPPFSELFLTPHGLNFEPVARMFGAAYIGVQDRAGFRKALTEAIQSDLPTIIEVPSDSLVYEKKRKDFITAISNQISALPNKLGVSSNDRVDAS